MASHSSHTGTAARALQGSASGFLAQARVFGQSLSIAMAGAIFVGLGGATAGAVLASQHLNGAPLAALQQTFLSGMQVAFLTCTAVAALGFFATLVRGKEERRSIPHMVVSSGEDQMYLEGTFTGPTILVGTFSTDAFPWHCTITPIPGQQYGFAFNINGKPSDQEDVESSASVGTWTGLVSLD